MCRAREAQRNFWSEDSRFSLSPTRCRPPKLPGPTLPNRYLKFHMRNLRLWIQPKSPCNRIVSVLFGFQQRPPPWPPEAVPAGRPVTWAETVRTGVCHFSPSAARCPGNQPHASPRRHHHCRTGHMKPRSQARGICCRRPCIRAEAAAVW